jgi:hypothetical protein
MNPHRRVLGTLIWLFPGVISVIYIAGFIRGPTGLNSWPQPFALFINDISAGISEGTSIMLYADDTKIWRDINNESDFFTYRRTLILYSTGPQEIR